MKIHTNLINCKWLNECAVYPVGKTKPTRESVKCTKQMGERQYEEQRENSVGCGGQQRHPKGPGSPVNPKGFRVEFR